MGRYLPNVGHAAAQARNVALIDGARNAVQGAGPPRGVRAAHLPVGRHRRGCRGTATSPAVRAHDRGRARARAGPCRRYRTLATRRSGASMTPERTAALVARWVRFYTRDVPAPVADRRIGEIDAPPDAHN